MMHFSNELPDLDFFEELLGERVPFVLYDQSLLKYPETAAWLNDFEFGFSLASGENLKDLEYWPDFLKKFLPMTKGLSSKEIVLVAVGGGSVGDFVGFLASVLKRGVSLWQVPTTWLAAMDSAHGGKTALNISHFKNQIGTYHPAEKVFISKQILSTQSQAQEIAAFGELAKMALISKGDLLAQLNKKSMWELLPLAIEGKLNVVKQDPFEKNGIRQVLNLGHTFGHALELHHNVPHGEAVLLGLDFAIEWSRQRGTLSEVEAQKILPIIRKPEVKKMTINRGQLREAILHDKKAKSGESIRFVFLKSIGEPLVEAVPVEDLVQEADRQGWTHG
jgi:3-dehydroquinate synthase